MDCNWYSNLMVKIKNKQMIYTLSRHDFSGKDCVVAASDSFEKINDLEGEYTQAMLDKGCTNEEFYFYVTGVIFYES